MRITSIKSRLQVCFPTKGSCIRATNEDDLRVEGFLIGLANPKALDIFLNKVRLFYVTNFIISILTIEDYLFKPLITCINATL